MVLRIQCDKYHSQTRCPTRSDGQNSGFSSQYIILNVHESVRTSRDATTGYIMTKHARKTSEALADSSLLDKIDKLFACNVGEYIDLPQLVVIGDQSSGKSSVLEGLTSFTFPRDSGLCTRHATQIIFRRTNDGERRITASIIPGLNDPEERAAQLREWVAEDIHNLTPNSLSELMADVS